MSVAEPRKNANGETAMRPYLMGKSSGTRPCSASRNASNTLGRLGAGFH